MKDKYLTAKEISLIYQILIVLENVESAIRHLECENTSIVDVLPRVSRLINVFRKSINYEANLTVPNTNTNFSENYYETLSQSSSCDLDIITDFGSDQELYAFSDRLRSEVTNVISHGQIPVSHDFDEPLRCLHKSLYNRSECLFQNEDMVMASLLNPSYKDLCFLRLEEEDRKNRLRSLYSNLKEKLESEIPSDNQMESRYHKATKLNLVIGEEHATNTNRITNDDELNYYFNSSKLETTSLMNTFDWWRYHQHLYPRLYQIAMNYLTIQASSSSIERCWSRAKQILKHSRLKMNDENFRRLLLLNFNHRFYSMGDDEWQYESNFHYKSTMDFDFLSSNE